jgi:hypothetical protein
VLVHPVTWQVANGLRNWQSLQKKFPNAPDPLRVARSRWPTAPLQYQVDDGKAAALFLADLAAEDSRQGIDRQALNAARDAKSKVKRQKARNKRRENAPGGTISEEFDIPY